MKNLKITKGTLTRTIILFLALINQVLTVSGYSVIDLDDETITETVSLAWTIIAALAAWWKNNSFTENAILADEHKKTLDDVRR